MTNRAAIPALVVVVVAGALVWNLSPSDAQRSVAATAASSKPESQRNVPAILAREPAPIDQAAGAADAPPEEASARRARRIGSLLPSLRTEYADLGEVVSLTPVERDTLLLLIATYRVQTMETELAYAADGLAGMRALDLLAKQRLADLLRLLGVERRARVIAFDETVPIRMETRLVAQLLEDTPWPMSQEQLRRLTGAAIEAFERQPDPVARRSGAENPDAVNQEIQARLEQDYVTLLQVARAVLNAEQYAHYAIFMEQRNLGDVAP